MKSSNSSEYVGFVESIWNIGATFVLYAFKMEASVINPYYKMRQFSKTRTAVLLLSKVGKSYSNSLVDFLAYHPALFD